MSHGMDPARRPRPLPRRRSTRRYPLVLAAACLLTAVLGGATILLSKESFRGIAAEKGHYGPTGAVTMTSKSTSGKEGTKCRGDFRAADGRVRGVRVHHSGPCRQGRRVQARLVDMKGRTIPWPLRQEDEAWVKGTGSYDLLFGPLLGLLFTLPCAAGTWYLRKEWRQEVRLSHAETEQGGRLLTAHEAAVYLRIRGDEFPHFLRTGWLRPADLAHTIAGTLDLYRQRDLDALLAHPHIDWPAVRAASNQRSSPLAGLPPRD
ncbi:hypothetical protein [Spirillospora sp. CA-294931]|uniref:hypothetical protein n=1 Tax=Spirillospora sp. CA-294931 TaxID=3240042 RepID=UPI003D91C951